MGITGVILLVVLSVGVIYLVMGYNQLVQIKHNVSKAWANIDVLLKQRHDELPKLVQTCEGYMQHERGTLEAVVKALPALRNPTISQLSSPDWIALETIIDESVVREIIPQLKALGAEGIVEYPLNKVVY